MSPMSTLRGLEVVFCDRLYLHDSGWNLEETLTLTYSKCRVLLFLEAAGHNLIR